MKIYDISVALSADTMKYPSLPPFVHTIERDYSKGNDMSLSSMQMVMHLGTHLDAPYHYVEDGKKIHELELDLFLGDTFVVVCAKCVIGEADALRGIASGCTRVLFKTPYSKAIDLHDDMQEASYFSREAASAIAKSQIRLLGIDCWSIDKPKDVEKFVHKTILGAGIAVLEGVSLTEVEEGWYFLSALPLSVLQAEGVPCRAVLVERESL